ncbi:hypothetical protein [Shewanella sediminis]|uniref:hypothetical protein n=1 Tax=Shewanella sediminis TaxID=271097 RepID=UPI0002F1B729|nr:hypothetical protein [Shewanella sediminis]
MGQKLVTKPSNKALIEERKSSSVDAAASFDDKDVIAEHTGMCLLRLAEVSAHAPPGRR